MKKKLFEMLKFQEITRERKIRKLVKTHELLAFTHWREQVSNNN
jgi:hypothetical protein